MVLAIYLRYFDQEQNSFDSYKVVLEFWLVIWSCCCCCLLTKLCLSLCNPMGCSLPDSSVHGISQARILEWISIPFSRDLPDPGIEPASPALAGRFFTTEPPRKPPGDIPTHKRNKGLCSCGAYILEGSENP